MVGDGIEGYEVCRSSEERSGGEGEKRKGEDG